MPIPQIEFCVGGGGVGWGRRLENKGKATIGIDPESSEMINGVLGFLKKLVPGFYRAYPFAKLGHLTYFT